MPRTPARRGTFRPPRIFVYVDAVARHGSIRKAADAVKIASSALNRRILDLEKELGVPLFERLPRGVRLTAAGELFVVYVRRTLADLEGVGSQIEALRGLMRGSVRIAAAESVVGALLPRAIAQFRTRHPKVRFWVKVGGPQDLVEALVEDAADLILTHDATEHKDVTIVAAVPQDLCVLVVPEHPLAHRSSVRLQDCLDYPIAVGDETLAGRSLIDKALAQVSLEFEPTLVSNSVETMKAFARIGDGVCFQFMTRGIGADVPGGMVAVPLTDPSLRRAHLYLATRRERVLPIAAAAFVEQMKGMLEQF